MQKIKNYIVSHPNLFTILGLGGLFYLIFFHNIWAYALMDVDESRYVSMAKDMYNTKDFLTLYLNHEFFFEKPPLYFWGECLSFAIFGKINEFTARFPVALYGSLCCYLIYFMGNKIVSRSYGVISSLILATSLEFTILSKFAILDIVVSTCIGFSLCFGMIVYFCRENHKKYYWWLFYVFSGLAVMAKGLPGFVIPFGSMFFIAIVSKKLKDIFKPIYIIPGLLLFMLIVLPWHVAMFKLYNPLFWDEYIVKHHLARFLGSEVINREQPFYFYFITLLWGFFPWVVSCMSVWINNIIQLFKTRNFSFDIEKFSNPQKFMLYNTIIALFTLIFFSLSGTKLITYILPVYASLACLGGYVWLNYITKKEHEKLINVGVYFIAGFFLLTSFAGILTPLYLPKLLLADISSAKTFCILTPFATGLGAILFARKRNYIGVFASFVIFVAMFSAIATEKFFEIDYRFGQNDLLRFAQQAKKNNVSLTTFNFGHKYSLLYYGEIPVTFGPELEPHELDRELDKDRNWVIIQLKDMKFFEGKDFDIIDKGRKYALIEEKGEIK